MGLDSFAKLLIYFKMKECIRNLFLFLTKKILFDYVEQDFKVAFAR